jgi:TatD DNase family protein
MADRHNRDIDRQLAPAPKPLPVPTVDAHAHLEIVTDAAPDSDAVRQVLDDAKAAGIDRVVQVGYSAEQSRWCVAAAEHFSDRVLAAVALHPNEAPVVTDLDADLKIIEELAQHPRVRAIGETGLDYFRTPPELRSRQQESFKWHIELAKLCIDRGYILSFAGTLTFKNAPALRDAVKLVPHEQLLVETDSPFLAPAPHRGALNTPAQIANIVRAMAEERNESVGALAQALSVNAERIFGSFAAGSSL